MLNDPINDTDHHVKRLCNGALLFASEELQDGNFVDSLVLICIHNADGAFGLILNRPTHMPLVEVFNIDPVYLNVRRSIYMGGPVDEEVLNILHITDTPATNAFRVQGRVFLGGEWSSVESILDENQEDVRMFLGYSGWHAGQLEQEISQGDWEVFNVDMEQFLRDWMEPKMTDRDSIRAYLRGITIDAPEKQEQS